MFATVPLLLGLNAGCLSASEPVEAAPARPNVIIVLGDALRADKTGPYGYDARDTTPNLDRFAGRSTVFSNAICQNAWTVPSVASLFTQVEPQGHQVLRYQVEKRVEMDTMSLDHTTLAEQFKAAGYKTGALLKSKVIDSSRGFSQGFDDFRVIDGVQAHGVTGQQLTNAATAWIDRQKGGEPFFLYLHYMDPHSPYMAPEPLYGKYADGSYGGPFTGLHKEIVPYQKGEKQATDADVQHLFDLYDAEVEYFDQQFGRLMKHLVSTGVDGNTIVVVTADHGEAFSEHGQYFHGNLYQENVVVPFIVKAPGAKARTLDAWVEMIDIGATVADLAGVPKADHWMSVSQADAVRGGKPVKRLVYSEYANQKAVYDPSGLKAIFGDGAPQLYDLKRDPHERKNLAQARPQDLARLRQAAVDRFNAGKALSANFAATESQELSDDQVEALRALGYIE